MFSVFQVLTVILVAVAMALSLAHALYDLAVELFNGMPRPHDRMA